MPKTATRTTPASPKAIPYDVEPLTAADLKAIREADAAFRRGDYCTVNDLQADLDADVAGVPCHKTPKRRPAKVSR